MNAMFDAERRWLRILLAFFGISLVLAAAALVAAYWAEPYGGWDAWDVWNKRAHFVFRAGPDWPQTFLPLFHNTDYPFLLPATIVRCWSYLGDDPTWTPWLMGALWTLATIGLLTAGVWQLRSRMLGLMAGMVLLGSVPFLRHGAAQYADVPLAFYILAGVLLPAMYDASDPPRRGLLFLGGLAAGLAAWTKNEGLLFVLAVPTARILAAWSQGRLRRLLTELPAWLAGALPLVVLIVLYKTNLAGTNNLTGTQATSTFLSRLLDVSRYGMVAAGFVGHGAHLIGVYIVLLPLCFLLLGKATDSPRGVAGLRAALLTLVLMLAGYFFVFEAMTPDLEHYVKAGAERLLMQLWPAALLVLFLPLASPEERLRES